MARTATICLEFISFVYILTQTSEKQVLNCYTEKHMLEFN